VSPNSFAIAKANRFPKSECERVNVSALEGDRVVLSQAASVLRPTIKNHRYIKMRAAPICRPSPSFPRYRFHLKSAACGADALNAGLCLFVPLAIAEWADEGRPSVSGDGYIAAPAEVAAISVEADIIEGGSAGGFLESEGIGGDLDGIRDGSEMS
jgi:hypothetical protein